MAMPRMDALAELQWNNPNPDDRDFDAFVERCRRMAQLYDLYHYNYAKQFQTSPLANPYICGSNPTKSTPPKELLSSTTAKWDV